MLRTPPTAVKNGFGVNSGAKVVLIFDICKFFLFFAEKKRNLVLGIDF